MQLFTRRARPRLATGDLVMDLILQFGYGMMDHCRSLLSAWGGGTVILSPRDLKHEQLLRLAGEITDTPGGSVLVDPQFYLPHADHERLVAHAYWPKGYDTGGFWSGTELARLLNELLSLNRALGCRDFILPGLFAPRVDEDWLARQKQVIEEARSLGEIGMPLLATVALGSDAVRSDDDIHEILDSVNDWAVDGVYLVCEHPNGEYLVRDATWLANLLDLTAGIRLKGKRVVVGYANHQMLALASAGATAIASGTWMNVRSFPPEKFRVQYDEEIKQRTTWYYCPQALSEYKIPFLDIAQRQRVLADMRPAAALGSTFADALFAGPQPSTIGFTEQAAFRHYLTSLHGQVRSAVASTFDETVSAHEGLLDAAETLLQRLQSVGVRGQLRDFTESIDVNRAALSVLRTSRGALLQRRWSSL